MTQSEREAKYLEGIQLQNIVERVIKGEMESAASRRSRKLRRYRGVDINRIKSLVVTVSKLPENVVEKYFMDRPELLEKIDAAFLESRLRADANFWETAEDDAGLELKIRERLDPDYMPSLKVIGDLVRKLSDVQLDALDGELAGTPEAATSQGS